VERKKVTAESRRRSKVSEVSCGNGLV
jgi:hypothetical protein